MPISEPLFIKVGALAEVSPRTVRRYYNFGPEHCLRSNVRVIRAALARLGFPDPHPAKQSANLESISSLPEMQA